MEQIDQLQATYETYSKRADEIIKNICKEHKFGKDVQLQGFQMQLTLITNKNVDITNTIINLMKQADSQDNLIDQLNMKRESLEREKR